MFRDVLAVALALSLTGSSRADEGPPPDGTPSGTTLPSRPPAPLPPPTQPSRPDVPPGSVLVPYHPHEAARPAALETMASWTARRPRTGILVAGVALFVGGYLGDVGFTYGYDHQPAGTSLIPLAGPWLQLGQHYGLSGPPVDTGSLEADARAQRTIDQANTTIRGLALSGQIISGLMQATGVVLVLVGAVLKKRGRTFANGAPRTTAADCPGNPAPNSLYLLRF